MKKSGVLCLFAICLSLVTFTANAQIQYSEIKFDSLVKMNNRYQKQDEVKLKLLLQLCKGYVSMSPAKGLETGDQAISLAKSLNNQLLLGEAISCKGTNHAAKGEYKEAKELYEKALVINQELKNTYGIAFNTLSIGSIYMNTGDSKKAKDLYEEALTKFEEINNKEGSEKCYRGLGMVYSNFSDYPKSLEYFQKALSLSESIGNRSLIATDLGNIGLVYWSQSHYTKALEYFNQVMSIFEKLGSKRDIAVGHGNIGLVYSDLSDYPRALEYFQKALTINEQLGNKYLIAVNLGNIGYMHIKLSNYQKAYEYFDRALSINQEMGNKKSMAGNLANIGTVYESLQDYPKALEYNQKALSINEQIGNKGKIGTCLGNLANVNFKISNYSLALEYYQKALNLFEQLGLKNDISASLNSIGNWYCDAPDSALIHMGTKPENRFEKSLDYLNRGLKIAEELGEISEQKQIWKGISHLYEKQGDFFKAHEAYKKYITLRDSAESKDIKQRIEQKEMQFTFDKKETEFKFQQQLSEEKLLRSIQEAQIYKQKLFLSNKEKDLQHLAYLKERSEKQRKDYLLNLSEKEQLLQQAKAIEANKETEIKKRELELSQAEVRRQDQQRNAFIMGIVLLIILSFFIYRNFINQKKLNEVISAEKKNSELTLAKLEEANKELESFSYSVSHDLRAPLRALSGYAKILEEDFSDNFDEEAKVYLLSIQNNSKRMGQLIDDLLAFSRLGRKKLASSTINMDALVHTLLDEGLFEKTDNTEIIINNLLPVNGDQNLLKQVWVNLISNAIKYSKNKPRQIIEIGSTKKNTLIEYYIRDNGAGFDMQYYNKLFGVFQRLHSQEEFEGTGIGLAIVQKIIQRHNGAIWAESKLHEGTTFYFSLPASNA